MGFINEIDSEENKICEKYNQFKWTVDYERKVYLNCFGTNRFGYTHFIFRWDAIFTDAQSDFSTENKLDCQASRDINKESQSINYKVYLPELKKYSDSTLKLFEEAIIAYGLSGKPIGEAWSISVEFIAERVSDYIPETNFMNEKIPQELSSKYDSNSKTWAIDKQRNAMLFCTGNNYEYKTFKFYWNNEVAGGFVVEKSGYEDEWDIYHICYEVIQLGIAPELSDKREEVLNMMEEAIKIYGASGKVGRGDSHLREDKVVEFNLPAKFREEHS
tara:strand:+ start:178 stop:999 length:822 start_codon:yes stop_codon:yes gene_type:complete